VGLNKKRRVILKRKNPTDFTQTGLRKYCVTTKSFPTRVSQLVNDDDVVDLISYLIFSNAALL